MLTFWRAVFATEDIKFETWDDLKGDKVAYSRGRKNVEKLLPQFLPKEQIVPANDDVHAFKMLSDGIVDVVVSESRLGDDLLQRRRDFFKIS